MKTGEKNRISCRGILKRSSTRTNYTSIIAKCDRMHLGKIDLPRSTCFVQQKISPFERFFLMKPTFRSFSSCGVRGTRRYRNWISRPSWKFQCSSWIYRANYFFSSKNGNCRISGWMEFLKFMTRLAPLPCDSFRLDQYKISYLILTIYDANIVSIKNNYLQRK